MQSLVRRPKTAQALALRARIVLACADGLSNSEVSRRLGVSLPTVGKWRCAVRRRSARRPARRTAAGRAAEDHRRPGRGGHHQDAGGAAVRTRHALVHPVDGQGGGHVADRGLADLAGVRPQAAPVDRPSSCRPTRCSSTRSATSSGCTSTRPTPRMVLCVDEKSQIQALDRTAPVLPMMPGAPGAADPRLHPSRHHHPVRRPGRRHRQGHRPDSTARHRHQEFLRFLRTIDAQAPADLDLHLVLDNYATHKTPVIQKWLLEHPRFHLHFTPTTHPGSTWSSAGSPSSPTANYAAPPTAASPTSKPT